MRALASWTILFALALAPAIAGAGEPTDVDRDLARASVQKGDELEQKGDFVGALKAYRYADEIMRVPTTGIEVVHMELKLGHLVEAFEACYRTTRYPEKPHEPAPFTRARKEALDLIVSLKKRIPHVTVEIRAQNSDAVPLVTIDDKPIDAYGDVSLNPGDHHASASASGHITMTADFHLDEADGKTVTIELLREPPPIDKPVAEPTSLWPMAYVGLGVAAAGVIVGSITGGLMYSARGELDTSCNASKICPPDQQATLDHAYAMANVSTVSFVIAGVGAAVGVTGLVLSLRQKHDNPPPPPALGLTPMFDGRGRPIAGAMLTFSR